MTPVAQPPGLEWVTADGSAWGRVLEEGEVETVISELGGLDYLGELASSFLAAISDWLTGHVSVGVLTAFVEVLRWGLGIGLVVLTLLLVRRLIARYRGRVVEASGWQRPPDPAPTRRLSRSDWQEAFGRCLADGDIRGALEALWWAMAQALAPSGLDESWTTDEVLAAAPGSLPAPRRSLLLKLDRLLYRGDPVEADSLGRLAEVVFGSEAVSSSGTQSRSDG